VKFYVPREEIHLEYYLTSTIYRIVQEALTNINKHAAAQSVEVDLSYQNGDLILTITDDGKGFDPDRLPRKDQPSENKFGLEGMRERAELIQGTMSIQSKPGSGTKIVLWIPLGKTSD